MGGGKQSKTEQLPGRELVVTRLHAWVPLSIKVSETGRSSSAEGDVRASLAPLPMLAPGEFLRSPSFCDCLGALRFKEQPASAFCCVALLSVRDGLVFPPFTPSDLIRCPGSPLISSHCLSFPFGSS